MILNNYREVEYCKIIRNGQEILRVANLVKELKYPFLDIWERICKISLINEYAKAEKRLNTLCTGANSLVPSEV